MSWRQEFLERSGNENTDFPIILLGNKCDLVAERKISKEKAKEWAEENKLIFDEISAKEDIRVEDAFVKAARLCMSREDYARPSLPVKPLVLKPPVAEGKKKSGCC